MDHHAAGLVSGDGDAEMEAWMDRDRFGALARLLGASGSRRATVGALLGAALPSDGQTFEQCNLASVSAEDCNGC